MEYEGERPGDWEPADATWFEDHILPRYLFHCAPQAARAAIAEHGLDPTKRIAGLLQDEDMREGIGERAWPDAVYLWGTLEEALAYARSWSQATGPRDPVPMDIYEMECVGYVQPDPMSTGPGHGGQATYMLDYVPADAIRHAGEMTLGEFVPHASYDLHEARVWSMLDHIDVREQLHQLEDAQIDEIVQWMPSDLTDDELYAAAVTLSRREQLPRNWAELVHLIDDPLREQLSRRYFDGQIPGQITLLSLDDVGGVVSTAPHSVIDL